MMMCIKVV